MPTSSHIPVILLVDDEPANLNTFVRVFRKDLSVRTSPCGSHALDQLERERVDLVISDYTMPDINGIELLRSVAARWPRIGRVMVTGHSDLVELHEAQRSGLVDELLPKPWRRGTILEAVNRLLAKRSS